MRLSALLATIVLASLASVARADGDDRAAIQKALVERPTNTARGELIVLQTLHGMVLGTEVCVLVDCSGARAVVGSVMLGGGAGFALSFLATQDGITSGHAGLVNTGSLWGAWNGLAIAGALKAYDKDNADKTVSGALIAGQLAGTAGAVLLATQLAPTAGDVAFASTIGLWGGFSALMVEGVADKYDASSQAIWITLLVSSDLALAAGTQLADMFPMGRGRAFLIDAGGGLGAIAGVGVDILIEGNSPGARGVSAGALVGGLTGLALTTYLTRNFDLPSAPALQIGALPVRGGALATVGFGW